jgi:predicted glutamine amidotransferase
VFLPIERSYSSLFDYYYTRQKSYHLLLTIVPCSTLNHSGINTGWGLAFYDSRDSMHTFSEVTMASCCNVVRQVCQSRVKTKNLIAHIRFATKGEVHLRNVHPFRRSLWGQEFLFAHNGDIPQYRRQNNNNNSKSGPFTSIGETDSEAFFVDLLNYLYAEFGGNSYPPKMDLCKAISKYCTEITCGEEGIILNFILSSGPQTLFAYSHPGSRPGSSVWNGLYFAVSEDCSGKTRVVVITTKPPTTDNKVWFEIQRGESILFEQGVPFKFSPVSSNSISYVG